MEVFDMQRRARASSLNMSRASVYRVRNPTDYVAEIFDARREVALLGPGEEGFISEPKGLLTARVKIPHGGRLTIVMVELRPVGGTVWEVPQR